jgi:voltage-gated sodium channel
MKMPRDLPSLQRELTSLSNNVSNNVPPVTMQMSSKNLEPDETWSPLRIAILRQLRSPLFEVGIGVVILVNVILVIMETDAAAQGDTPQWMETFNYTLLSIYTVELALGIFVYRGSFLRSLWNIMDLCIVGMDLVFLLVGFLLGDMPSFSILRMVRLARLTRSYKVLILFPELYLMIKGLAGALKVIFWGTVLSALVLTFWSILAVHLIHPVNQSLTETGYWKDCERCPRAFSSVMQSNLTFMQQVVAGDAWGELTIPIIEYSPTTVVFFLAVFLSKSMLILNLILGMILDAAQEARKGSHKEQVVEVAKLRAKAHQRLLRVCAELDVEQTGCLSLHVLLHGYEAHPEFSSCLQAMDIQKSDIEPVFSILDEGQSGQVSYTQFAEQVHKMKSSSSHTLLVFIKHYVMQIRAKLAEQLETVERQLFDTISSKTVTVEVPCKTSDISLMISADESSDGACRERVKQRPEEAILDALMPELALLRQVKDELVTSIRDLSLKSENQVKLSASLSESLSVLSGMTARGDALLSAPGRQRNAGHQALPPPKQEQQPFQKGPKEAPQHLPGASAARAWPLQLCSPELGNLQEAVVSSASTEHMPPKVMAMPPSFYAQIEQMSTSGQHAAVSSYGPTAAPLKTAYQAGGGVSKWSRDVQDGQTAILRVPRPLLDRQAKHSLSSVHGKAAAAATGAGSAAGAPQRPADVPKRWVQE